MCMVEELEVVEYVLSSAILLLCVGIIDEVAASYFNDGMRRGYSVG